MNLLMNIDAGVAQVNDIPVKPVLLRKALCTAMPSVGRIRAVKVVDSTIVSMIMSNGYPAVVTDADIGTLKTGLQAAGILDSSGELQANAILPAYAENMAAQGNTGA